MGVPGVPAGAPAGAAAGTPAGNVAGEVTTIVDTDRDISGKHTTSAFGTTPVGPGTIYANPLFVENIRFVARGLGKQSTDNATLNVMANFAAGPTQGWPRDLISDQVTGGFEITQPGATVNVQPDQTNMLAGRPYHSFTLAQRGGTLGTGTLTTEITAVHG